MNTLICDVVVTQVDGFKWLQYHLHQMTLPWLDINVLRFSAVSTKTLVIIKLSTMIVQVVWRTVYINSVKHSTATGTSVTMSLLSLLIQLIVTLSVSKIHSMPTKYLPLSFAHWWFKIISGYCTYPLLSVPGLFICKHDFAWKCCPPHSLVPIKFNKKPIFYKNSWTFCCLLCKWKHVE